MKFLCGRPGCGQESTATLQIDAVSSTVSLVDPRTSRDGVPLCSRHADATTPPMGWAMNDMRSTAHSADHNDDGVGIVSAPPRNRPDRVAERGSRRMSQRQSIAERARQDAMAAAGADDPDDRTGPASTDTDGHEGVHVDVIDADAVSSAGDDGNGHRAARETIEAKVTRRGSNRPGPRATRRGRSPEGPESRPARRRDASVDDEATADDERFPWHFQFDEDDEPQELQASTPLLSRAFRATTG